MSQVNRMGALPLNTWYIPSYLQLAGKALTKVLYDSHVLSWYNHKGYKDKKEQALIGGALCTMEQFFSK